MVGRGTRGRSRISVGYSKEMPRAVGGRGFQGQGGKLGADVAGQMH